MYVTYLEETHNVWRAISSFLSPIPPPTDLRRQENHRRFTINNPKRLHRHQKISVWNTTKIDKEADCDGGQAQPIPRDNNNEKGDTMVIACRSCW